MSYSQIGQDIWVLEQLGHKRNGYFLDIGAAGEAESNTILLEREYGWNGLVCEPQQIHRAFLESRQCAKEYRPISDKSEVVFAYTHGDARVGWSGIKDSLRDEALGMITSEERLEAVSIAGLFSQHKVPHYIDYCSLDVEGAEMEILKMLFPSIPCDNPEVIGNFDQYYVKLLTIEHGFGPDRQNILDFMLGKGYNVVDPGSTKQDFWFYK